MASASAYAPNREDRAEQLKRDPDKVAHELEQQLREDLRKIAEFSRVHILPHSGGDVPDDYDARLVVLGPDHAYSRDKDSAAEVAAKEILESRGSAPRLFRNTLVFLAADKVRYQDLDEALRKYLAWDCLIPKPFAHITDSLFWRREEPTHMA
jgi:hypothetical protein